MKQIAFITLLLALVIDVQAQNIFPSSGSAGIGTTTPNSSSALEVKSTTQGVLIPRMTKVQRNAIASPATGLLIFQTDGTAGFYYYTGSKWMALKKSDALSAGTGISISGSTITNTAPSQWSSNGSDISFENGKVGIGTTYPSSSLDIETTDQQAMTVSGTSNVGTWFNLYNSNGAWNLITTGNANGEGSGKLLFRDGWGVKMTITPNDGNVGIGTSFPSQKLEVAGTTKTSGLQLTNGASNGFILRSDSNGNASWINPGSLSSWTTDGDNQFSALDGNVGIGVSTPSQKLEVSGTIKANSLQVTDGAADGYVLQGNSDGYTSWVDPFVFSRVSSSTTNNVPRYNGSSLIDGDIYDVEGKVGINTSAPQHALDVSGIIEANGLILLNNAAEGYLLRTDANGNASWTNPSGLFSAGNGIELNGTTITNTSPDQTVTITGSGATSVSGVYPNFTISSTDNNTDEQTLLLNGNDLSISNGNTITLPQTIYTAGTGIDVTGTTITNTSPDQTVILTGSGGTTVTGSYPNFTVSSASSSSMIEDADGNTKVETEQSANDDKIHFTLGGVEYFKMNRGTIECNNPSGSVYLGTGSGSADTYSISGLNNVGVGTNTLQSLTGNIVSTSNTAVGANALQSLNTGASFTTAIGANALKNFTGTGNSNIAVGVNAGYLKTSGALNVFIGGSAGYNNTTGTGNVFLGNGAGFNETGSNKLYIDNNSTSLPLIYGDFNTNKITINDSLQSKYFTLTNGATNGYVLQSDASGNANWVNPSSLNIYSAGTGISISGTTVTNTAPDQTLTLTGSGGTSISGSYPNFTVSSASTSTKIQDADGNTSVQTEKTSNEDQIHFTLGGTEYFNMNKATLEVNNTQKSIYIGTACGTNDALNGSGENTGVGSNAFQNLNNNCSKNVAVGVRALQSLSSGGSNNVAIGENALQANTGGTNNVALGTQAGQNASGSSNIFIGNNAGANETGSNKLYIDNSSSTTPLIYGDFSNDYVTINSKLGVGVTSPTNALEVSGTTKTTSLQVTSGANNGYVLKSDASGNASWVNPTTLANGSWAISGNNQYSTVSGNVGMGTTTPTSKLEVSGDVRIDGYILYFKGSSDVNHGIGYYKSGSTNGTFDGVDLDGPAVFGYGGGILGTSINGGKTAVLRWNSSGNVGIGTTSPTARLHVSGTSTTVTELESSSTTGSALSLSNTSTGGSTFTMTSTGSSSSSGVGKLVFSTQSNSVAIAVDGSADVGIGTSSPSNKLSVSGNANISGNTGLGVTTALNRLDVEGGVAIGSSYSGTNTAPSNGAIIQGHVGIGTNAPANTLDVEGGIAIGGTYSGTSIAPADGAIIEGNVGVGTPSPVNKLDVEGGIAIGSSYSGTSTAPSNGAIIQGNVGIGTSSTLNKLDVAGGIAIGNSYSGTSTAPSNGAIIQGNVGIGTSSPTTKLEISGTTKTTNLQMTTGASNGYLLQSDASGNASWVSQSSLGDEWITSGNDIYNNNSANVGIGTTSPDSKFHVSASKSGINTFVGEIENTGNGGSAYNNSLLLIGGSDTYSSSFSSQFIGFKKPNATLIGAVIQNGGSSVSYQTTSDQRLKENIRDTKIGLKDLMKIQVSDYNYKDDPRNQQTGYIAQQLYTVFPDAVHVGGDDAKTDPWMVDYGRVTPLLVKSIQELNVNEDTDVNELKVENGKLKAEVDELKSEISSIKSEIKNLPPSAGEAQSKMSDGFAKLQTLNTKPETLLGQNIPNPFDNSTLIPFRIPKNCHDASIMITNTSTSEVISLIPISCNEDHVSIDAGILASGTYSYTLYVDGKMVDTKQMELLR